MATKFLKQYEILIKKAVVDLNTAKVVLDSFEEGKIELNLEVVFFHLQQCAEKVIKTLLDYKQVKFPHTHDIKNLIYLLNENNIETVDYIDNFIPLTDFAVEGRYAVIHDDLDDAHQYIEQLEALLKFVKNLL